LVMHVISVAIFRWMGEKPPILLTTAFELSSFGYFQRSSVKEVALFVSREVVSRSSVGQKQSVQHKEYLCHCHVTTNKLACAVITDADYPGRVAFTISGKVVEEFTKKYGQSVESYTKDTELPIDGLEALLVKYQDPKEADSIMKLQKDLDETKEVLVKSIDQLLVRGERLEVLAEKSQDLSFQSKAFVKQSEKLNCGCTII